MSIYEIINKYDDLINNIKFHSSIQIIDNQKIMIENCKKIIAFNENEICLELIKNCIHIVGIDLKMKNYSRTGVEINGKIHSLKFLNNDERKE